MFSDLIMTLDCV